MLMSPLGFTELVRAPCCEPGPVHSGGLPWPLPVSEERSKSLRVRKEKLGPAGRTVPRTVGGAVRVCMTRVREASLGGTWAASMRHPVGTVLETKTRRPVLCPGAPAAPLQPQGSPVSPATHGCARLQASYRLLFGEPGAGAPG